MQNIILNWSSGKDAAMAYWQLLQDKAYRVAGLLTSLSEQYARVSMHGITENILEAQAQRMALPLKKIYLPEDASMEIYDNIMKKALTELKQQGIDTMGFGDIFLENLRSYREGQLAIEGFKATFPLWKKETALLVKKVEDLGIKSMLVCVNEKYLGKEFLGRMVNRQLLADLPIGVDPCGENGEYHSLVVDAPFFSAPLAVNTGAIVHKHYPANNDEKAWNGGFYFLDVYLD